MNTSGLRRAAVLAGGLGTRLLPYTQVLPKPLVPVGDRPILELIFDWLARNGIESVDVCIGHLGELIQTYFSQAQTIPKSLEVNWRWESEALGTAGALGCIPDVTETLLVVNGDILTDLRPEAMVEFHRSRDAALTIATHTAQVRTELGVIDQEGGLVTDYREKPVFAYDASMGIYLYEPRVLRDLPPTELQFPELVLALLRRGERVGSFHTDAQWQHVGTPAQLREASRRVADPSITAGDDDDTSEPGRSLKDST